MPVRGKILNCLKAEFNKIFKSEIITDLVKVLGCGVEVTTKANKDLSTFDLNNLRWNKVVICTDADVDGFQIRTLILTMLYRLTPTLIEEGYVYIAESPLYEINTKDRTYFAYTEKEKRRYLEEIGKTKYTIQRSKGLGENEPEMMWLTTMNPETRRLIRVNADEAEKTAEMFDLMLGDNLQGRKDYIAENGARLSRTRGYFVIADRGYKNGKKKKNRPDHKKVNVNATIEGGGIIVDQPITQTIEQNYMPYAMSVIVSRALPEIDGFKPSHRKILYTMYKMGLLTGARTKSANIVGQTMKLNPHGDQAIYETMVRLSRGNEALLHPYVDSKGNFGKAYSRDMAYAASRYTEAKLDPICAEFFRDIDKDTVDFVPNYDNPMMEPTLLPATFPSVLVNSNVGIAVSMASSICPFNLKELCDTTIGLIRDPDYDLQDTLKGPDFPGGGYMISTAQYWIRFITPVVERLKSGQIPVRQIKTASRSPRSRRPPR